MKDSYHLRENIWDNFFSQKALNRFEDYIAHLSSQGKPESEVNDFKAHYRNGYLDELKKIGLCPEDRCILYGEYDVDIIDNDLVISYTYLDFEYYDKKIDQISFSLERISLNNLIIDLLKFNKYNSDIKYLKNYDNNSQKTYSINKFKDHIHLLDKDTSDYISIAIFSLIIFLFSDMGSLNFFK